MDRYTFDWMMNLPFRLAAIALKVAFSCSRQKRPPETPKRFQTHDDEICDTINKHFIHPRLFWKLSELTLCLIGPSWSLLHINKQLLLKETLLYVKTVLLVFHFHNRKNLPDSQCKFKKTPILKGLEGTHSCKGPTLSLSLLSYEVRMISHLLLSLIQVC